MRTGEIALERTETGLAVLTVSGEHDLSTAADLRSHFDRLIGDGGSIVVDLSPATFIDSSTLGTILEARRRAGEKEIGFEVAQGNGAQSVSRVLEVTGVRGELPVHPSREEAIATVAGGSGMPPE